MLITLLVFRLYINLHRIGKEISQLFIFKGNLIDLEGFFFFLRFSERGLHASYQKVTGMCPSWDTQGTLSQYQRAAEIEPWALHLTLINSEVLNMAALSLHFVDVLIKANVLVPFIE